MNAHRNITLRQRFVAAIALVAVAGASLPLRAETLTDRCSVQVVIKNPYANNGNIDPSDLLLDRSGNLGTVGSAMEAGHYRKIGSNGWSPFTAKIKVPKNGDGFFRWYCGTTAERSRCSANAKFIAARIGPDRKLETRCTVN
jgi:hypothetical protein